MLIVKVLRVSTIYGSTKTIKNILKEKFELFNKKYEISEAGNFEGSNILIEKSEPYSMKMN